MATDSSDTEETPKKRRSLKKPNKPSILIFVIFFVLIGLYLAYNTMAAQPGGSNNSTSIKTPNLRLSPETKKVTVSNPVAVEIWADTAGKSVNAVQANLTYPIDKLNFVSVDTTGSAFGLAVQAEGKNGKVTIARGSFEPVNGKLFVAKINFTGAARKGKAPVDFADGTALLSSESNKDILSANYGGMYTLTQ